MMRGLPLFLLHLPERKLRFTVRFAERMLDVRFVFANKRQPSLLVEDGVDGGRHLTGDQSEDFFCTALSVRHERPCVSGVQNADLWLVITTAVQVEGQPVTYLVRRRSTGFVCNATRVT